MSTEIPLSVFTPVDNQYALILGASSGFGAAVALKLAQNGMNIFGVHFDRAATIPNAERVKVEIETYGCRAIFWNVNAADAQVRATVIRGFKMNLHPNKALQPSAFFCIHSHLEL